MKIYHSPISTVATSLTLALACTGLSAAPISWTVQDITGSASDISTTGTLIEATSGSTSVATTVNGVTFAAGQILDSTTRNRPATIPTLTDSSYQTLLESASSTTNSNAQTITFSGLAVDKTYQIQIWASHTGFANSGLVLNNGSGVVNPATSGHATLLYEAGTGNPGQYAFGTFTADGTSQIFSVRRWRNMSTSQIAEDEPYVNAIQLREIAAIPEPSTALLGGLGLFALFHRRR